MEYAVEKDDMRVSNEPGRTDFYQPLMFENKCAS